MFREHINLITGGFPCQDLSIAGKRGGLKANRSGLFFELARVIGETEPDWFIIENVPGLLSSHAWKDMRIVLRTLAELRSRDGRRYCVAYRVLDSRFFGVAQRRRRVFIVGSLGNTGAIEVLFESEGVCGDIKKKRKAGGEVAHTLTRRTQKGGDPTRDQYVVAGFLPGQGAEAGIGYEEEISPTLKSAGSGASELPAIVSPTLRVGGRDNKHRAGDSSDNTPIVVAPLRSGGDGGIPSARRPDEIILAPTLGASGSGTDRPSAQGNDWQFCVYEENQRGEVRETKPSIKASRSGRNFSIVGEKTDSDGMRETSGLPRRMDDSKGKLEKVRRKTKSTEPPKETPDSPRYKALGNAVTVNVTEWIMKAIKTYEENQ